MTKQKGICEECKIEYEYEYNPKYPRKYCPECSAQKKAEFEGNVPTEKPGVADEEKPKSKGKYEPTSMYVSYAKDIFVSLIDDAVSGALTKDGCESNMKLAIELVKQAKESFE